MKLIILNHKMNLYYDELEEYFNRINKINKKLIIAPSNIYLTEFLHNTNHIIASQDICYIEEGNYTSKVSWKQIKSIGIKYSIIGHSERNEDLQKVNLKLKTCLENQIKPILCFGTDEEPIDELVKITKDISNIDDIIFAYEPINNIGNSNINISIIENNIKKIYTYLLDKYNKKPILLYGGGINENNIEKIYEIPKLDGILLGSVSADIQKLEKLLLHIK